MKNSINNREMVSIIIGVLLILTGLGCNEWILTKLLSSDGTMAISNKIIIWVIDIVFIVMGSILIFSRNNPQLLGNISLLVFTSVICLFFIEFFLRFIEGPRELRIYKDNPNKTGSYKLKPNLNIVWRGEMGRIIIKTNSRGIVGEEISYDNHLSKKRIAFVGDSHTFGCWVDKPENNFVSVFGSQLDRNKYEVINFGVGGYGLEDIELRIKEDVIPFKPDYLVLIFFNGNDLRDTYLGKEKYKIIGGLARWNLKYLKTRFPELYPEMVKESDSSKSQWLKRLIVDLSIFRRFASIVNIVSLSKIDDQPSSIKVYSDFKVSKSFNSFTYWSQKSYPEPAVKAKEWTLQVLDNIRNLCTKNQIKLVVVSLPYEDQVYSNSGVGQGYDIGLPQKYIEQYSEKHSIPYLDLLPLLRTYVKKNNKDVYVKNDVHFNNEGHQIIGELISDFFRKEMIR